MPRVSIPQFNVEFDAPEGTQPEQIQDAAAAMMAGGAGSPVTSLASLLLQDIQPQIEEPIIEPQNVDAVTAATLGVDRTMDLMNQRQQQALSQAQLLEQRRARVAQETQWEKDRQAEIKLAQQRFQNEQDLAKLEANLDAAKTQFETDESIRESEATGGTAQKQASAFQSLQSGLTDQVTRPSPEVAEAQNLVDLEAAEQLAAQRRTAADKNRASAAGTRQENLIESLTMPMTIAQKAAEANEAMANAEIAGIDAEVAGSGMTADEARAINLAKQTASLAVPEGNPEQAAQAFSNIIANFANNGTIRPEVIQPWITTGPENLTPLFQETDFTFVIGEDGKLRAQGEAGTFQPPVDDPQIPNSNKENGNGVDLVN